MNKGIIHTIIIYTLAHCPYCIKAKKLLDSKQVEFQEIAVEKFSEAERKELAKKANGVATVPQIFIDDKLVKDGYSGLYELEKQGKLDRLLEGQPKKPAPAG